MTRIKRAVVVTLACTVVVVACGGDDVSAAQRLVLGAAQRTFTADTAQVAFVIDGLDGAVSGEGPVDFGASQSRTTSTGFADGDTVVVNDGTDSFLQVDGLTPPGRFVDVSDDPAGIDGTDVIDQLLVVLEPIQLLQLLNGADDADDQGTQQIDGVDTTHVTATVDFDDAIDALEEPAKSALQRAVAGLDTRTATVDVFIDTDGRVRRLGIQLTLNDGTVVNATQNFTAFGDPVRIRVPKARRTLAPEEAAGIATADISGTWTVVSTIVDTDQPGVYATGAGEPSEITLTCDASGSCSTESGAWEDDGAGAFSFDRSNSLDCFDDAGNLTTSGGAEESTSSKVHVDDVRDGRATAMSGTIDLHVELTAAGTATNCTLNGVAVPEANASGTLTYTR